MSPRQEQLLPPDERIEAVGQWIQDNYRPALRVINEGVELGQQEPQQEFEVRRYQLEAWANVWDTRQQGSTRGLIHLATGLGKTSVAVFDVMRFREECSAQDPPLSPRVLFVSHMNDIAEQAHERFAHFMPDLDMAFFNTRRKSIPDADVTFATFQSLYSQLDRFDPQDYEYIIYDEAHHSEAETFKAVREYFDPLFELALTATPDRLDQQDIREYFGEPLYKKTLSEAIAEGWLVDVDYHIVFDDIVKQLMEDGFEPRTLKEFHELFKVRPRNEVIARNIREERHKIGLDAAKTIVFCEDVDHAEEMAELLGGVAYHSGIKKEDRKPILRGFRTGSNQVICTVDMFNEGIDIPDARLVVFLRSTSSGMIFEQQLGRGLRRMGGKEKVSVLDFVANIERIQKVRELSGNIQQRAQEVGDRDVTEEGTIYVGEQENSGLRIHSQHGDFDFDRIAVDLLEKYAIITAPNRWEEKSNQQLVEIALALSPDAALGRHAIDALSAESKFASSDRIRRKFGSLAEFQKACGFEPLREFGERKIVPQEMENEDIVALAKKISPNEVLDVERIKELSRNGQFVGMSTIYKRFGSMPNFRKACGFESDRKGSANKMTNEEIIAAARKIKPEGPLSSPEIISLSRKKEFVGYSFLMKRFGSLAEFQRACGFEPESRMIVVPQMSNEDILSRARELKPEEPLTNPEIRVFSRNGSFVSYDLIKQRFGSMEGFRKAWAASKGLEQDS